MTPAFLDLDDGGDPAQVQLLPLPFEGTVSYGGGTALGPDAIWRASTQVELWDEELNFDLDSLSYHSAPALATASGESPADYLSRVRTAASDLHNNNGLVIGVGGEHSLTPPLVEAALAGKSTWSDLTIVQLDAHADLRASYEGTPHSHACAMRRLVERDAQLLAFGIRSAERQEAEYGRANKRVKTFWAHELEADESPLLQALAQLRGDIYLTIDIDALEVHLCPATGTPQPGGLGWWQTLRYLRTLLYRRSDIRLLGCDLVETAPSTTTSVNEFVAARLLCKVLAYHFAP